MTFQLDMEKVNLSGDGGFHIVCKNVVTDEYETYRSAQGVKPY